MTILLYSRRKKWELKSIEVESTHHRIARTDNSKYITDGSNHTEEIRNRITIVGDLSNEQEKKLLNVADRCPVHRTIQSTPMISNQIETIIDQE